jgi:hypothetical protein
MKMTDTIWLVSEISAFLGEGLSTSQKNLFVWVTDKAEIVLDTDKKEIRFVDCELDMKTYFAIVGLASSRGLTTGDYFTEK